MSALGGVGWGAVVWGCGAGGWGGGGDVNWMEVRGWGGWGWGGGGAWRSRGGCSGLGISTLPRRINTAIHMGLQIVEDKCCYSDKIAGLAGCFETGAYVHLCLGLCWVRLRVGGGAAHSGKEDAGEG